MSAEVSAFKKKLRNLEPGRELVYHFGHLGRDRHENETVNQIASLAFAVDDTGHGAIFARRAGTGYEYVVKVFRRLGLRTDGNGGFQEVCRVAKLHEGRTRTLQQYA